MVLVNQFYDCWNIEFMMSSGREMLQQFQCNFCSRVLSSNSSLQRHLKTCQFKTLSFQENSGPKTPDTNIKHELSKNFMLPPIPSQLTVIMHQEKKCSRNEEPQITLQKISHPGSKDSSANEDEELLYQKFLPKPSGSGSTAGFDASIQTLHHCPFCDDTFSNFSHCQTHIKTVHKNECDPDLVERTCSSCHVVMPSKEDLREHIVTSHGDTNNIPQKNSSSSDGCLTSAEEDFTSSQQKEDLNTPVDSFMDCQLAVIKTEPEDVDSSPDMDLVQNEDLRDFHSDVPSESPSRVAMLEGTNKSLANTLSTSDTELGKHDKSANAMNTCGPSVHKDGSVSSIQVSQLTCTESGPISSRFTDVDSLPKDSSLSVAVSQPYNKPHVVHLCSPETSHEAASGSITGSSSVSYTAHPSVDHTAATTCTVSQENGQFIQESTSSSSSFPPGKVVSPPVLKTVTVSQGIVAISMQSLASVSVEPVYSRPDNNFSSGEPNLASDKQQFSVYLGEKQTAQGFSHFTGKDVSQVPSRSQDITSPGTSAKSKPAAKRPVLTCEVCNKTYRCRSSFKKHVNAHAAAAAAASLICKYCGQTFQQKDIFFSHMRLHEQNAFNQPQGGTVNLPSGGVSESNFQSAMSSGRANSYPWDTRQMKPGMEVSSNMINQYGVPMSTIHLSEDQVPFVTKEKQKRVSKRKRKPSSPLESDWMESGNYKRLASNNLYPWAENKYYLEPGPDGSAGTQESWTCENCNMVFQNLKLLEDHQRHCSFPRRKINFHNFSATEEERNIPSLPKMTRSPAYFQLLKKGITSGQLITNKNSKCLVCKICFRSFSKIENYTRHKKLHKYRCLVYACQYCGQFFSKRPLLEFHEQKHHEIMGDSNRYCCVYCDLPLRDKKTLKEHVTETHRGFRVLLFSNVKPDSGLSKMFWSSPKKLAALKNSMNKLSSALETSVFPDFLNNRICQCSHCLKEFNSAEAMSRHVCVKPSHIQQLSQGNFYCDVCQQFFATPEELQKHVEYRHTKVDLYRCEVCGVWGRKEEMERHMLSHMSKMGSFVSTEQNNTRMGNNFLLAATNVVSNNKSTCISSMRKNPSGDLQKKQVQEQTICSSSTSKKGKAKVKHSQAKKSVKMHEEFAHRLYSQESQLKSVMFSHTNQNQSVQKKLLTSNIQRQRVEANSLSCAKNQSENGNKLFNNKMLNKNVCALNQKNISVEEKLRNTTHPSEAFEKSRIPHPGPQNEGLKRNLLPTLSSQIQIVEVNNLLNRGLQGKMLERTRVSSEDKQNENIDKNPRFLINQSENPDRSNLPSPNNQSENPDRIRLSTQSTQGENAEKNRLSSQNTQGDSVDRTRLLITQNENSDGNSGYNTNIQSENLNRNRSSNLCNSNEKTDRLSIPNSSNQNENLNIIKVSNSNNQTDTSLKSRLLNISSQSENLERSRCLSNNQNDHSNRSGLSSLVHEGEQSDKSSLSSPLNQQEKNRLHNISSEIEIFDVSKFQGKGSHMEILEISRLPKGENLVENSESSCPSSSSSQSENLEKDFIPSCSKQNDNVDKISIHNSQTNSIEISQLPIQTTIKNDKVVSGDGKLPYYNRNIQSDAKKMSNSTNQGESLDRGAEYCITCEEFIPSHLFSYHLLEKHWDGGDRSDFLFDAHSLPDNEWLTDISEKDLGHYDELGVDEHFEGDTEKNCTTLEAESTSEK
ncbi:uncharacterized protein LOC106458729 isoform X2 [Limulus polyphemus]|uniref:Uncharacterized protein LOC106458729 isoform X2 n=1 Tax=Limulus polyphemus TaxID=6850 RepID=A0ABM1SAS8_LIMPO|nr:uncharacterized protein LOC106458729 isoform X2 [Limulus polyphemus]